MATLLESLLLGIVQGITEWLPISSSGHLVLVKEFFNIQASLPYILTLHIGTLLAVTFFYWKDITHMCVSLIRRKRDTRDLRFVGYILTATVATGIIGLLFHNFFTSLFTSKIGVAIALLINGIFLFICERWTHHKDIKTISAFTIGVAQAVSIIPGISRSGATIGTGLLFGIHKETAARFSFLLSIPTIIGAFILDFEPTLFTDVALLPMIIGIVTSFVVGYATLRILLKLILRNKFHTFAYYCWAIGLLILIIG